jgi:hypothetical protein
MYIGNLCIWRAISPWHSHLWSIVCFVPRHEISNVSETLHLGANLTLGCQLYTWVQILHLGANFTLVYKLYTWVQTLHLGANFTFGCKLNPWVQTLHLGANFTFGCKLYTWVQTLHLCTNYYTLGCKNFCEEPTFVHLMGCWWLPSYDVLEGSIFLSTDT